MQSYVSSPVNVPVEPVVVAFPGQSQAEPPVLAQIPDLDKPAADSLEEQPGRSGGRLISQKLSNRLLIGGGIVLALAAILPFTGGKKPPKPEGVPAWHPGPPAPTADAAPAWNAKTPAPTVLQPSAPSPLPAIDIAVPGAEPSAGMSIPTPPSDPRLPPGAPVERLPQAGSNQTMAVGGPAAGYGQDERLPLRRDYQADTRSDWRNDYRTAYPPSTPPENFRPGPGRTDTSGRVPPDAETGQPGVARLEGVITKPPARMSNERTGSSLY